MPSIQSAYNWAIATCTASNVGYSQQYRDQETVDGITYYDCSSFIWFALIAGGFDMTQFGTWPFTTYTMASILAQLGFVQHDPVQPYKAGDILLRAEHTEMAFDSTRTMGAHTNKVPLADQVSINSNPSTQAWLSLWRWETGAVNEWIKGNRYLTMAEMQNNATIIVSYFEAAGWTVNAIAGMLGNMQTESTINPGIWENLDPTMPANLGCGLVGWTPSTKYTDWAAANGYAWDDGNGQIKWIAEETVPTGAWIPISPYANWTWEMFIASTDTPETLADVWLYNFEKPAVTPQPARQTQARYWYDWINNSYVPPENPPENGGEWQHHMPLYMFLRRF